MNPPPSLQRLGTPRNQRLLKAIVAVVFVALLIGALWFFFKTDAGQKVLRDPKLLAADMRRLVVEYPVATPVCLMGVYVILATLGVLPVWWLQILAGVAFGLFMGVFWCLIAATISAVLGMLLSRWIAGDWFHRKVETKMERLKKLDELLGHNGFLLVMTVRLAHMLPFGLCNYALGLLKISVPDVVFGTFLGSIPSISLSVGVGAGYRPRDWRFILALVSINVLLLLPMAARYLKPEWFRKIGIK